MSHLTLCLTLLSVCLHTHIPKCLQVKCQSDGLGAAAVLQELLGKGGPAAFKALYAGGWAVVLVGGCAAVRAVSGAWQFARCSMQVGIHAVVHLSIKQIKHGADTFSRLSFAPSTYRHAHRHAHRPAHAGFVSAALCSVLVGSVHYASFCWSKRVALQAMYPTGSSDSSSSSGHSSSCDNTHQANMLAASIGALATALVESPVELFRHQAQAGTVNGNFVQEMVTSVRKNVSVGCGCLWSCDLLALQVGVPGATVGPKEAIGLSPVVGLPQVKACRLLHDSLVYISGHVQVLGSKPRSSRFSRLFA